MATTVVRTDLTLPAGIHTIRIAQVSGGAVTMDAPLAAGAVPVEARIDAVAGITAPLGLLGTSVEMAAVLAASATVVAPLRVDVRFGSVLQGRALVVPGALTVRVPMAARADAVARIVEVLSLDNDIPLETLVAATARLAPGDLAVPVAMEAQLGAQAQITAPLAILQIINLSTTLASSAQLAAAIQVALSMESVVPGVATLWPPDLIIVVPHTDDRWYGSYRSVTMGKPVRSVRVTMRKK